MRKILKYTVPGVRADVLGKRDNGKTFILTEMPADQAERWALRVLLAAGNGHKDIVPDGALQAALEGGNNDAAMAKLAAVGFRALFSIPWADAEPLLDEMMACVQYQPEAPGVMPQAIMTGVASQIEDAATRVKLRLKVFELHTGFSVPVGLPTSG
jgi:hypothetical protein